MENTEPAFSIAPYQCRLFLEILSIVLSLIGFVFLFRSRLFCALWLILILACKVGNGHAMSFGDSLDVALMDWIHLLAASIWVGGILYLIAHKRKFPVYTEAFYQSAFIKMIHVDAILMVFIVMIAGVFTYLNPMPVNTPLYWHEVGKTLNMTTQITPNIPGKNTFAVQVYLPVELSKPTSVRLSLMNKDDLNVAPIEVPLEANSEAVDGRIYEGLVAYTYQIEGPYLPFPGKWEVEVVVEDSRSIETKFNHGMLLF